MNDYRAKLVKIADELKPDVDRAVAELGVGQVRANLMNGLLRMHRRAVAEGRPSGAAMAAAEFGIDLDALAPPSAGREDGGGSTL